MSDLENKDIEEDFIQQIFIELTDYSKNEIKFPFSLEKYHFFIKRCDSCGREESLKPQIKKNIIFIEQENLHDGDFIKIIYKKK